MNPKKNQSTKSAHAMKVIALLGVGGSIAVAACPLDEQIADTEFRETKVEPYVVDGNPDCAQLGLGEFQFKADPPNSGTYDLDGSGPGTDAVVVSTDDGIYFNWDSSMEMDAVIVKGGPNANIYVYDPEDDWDGGLHSPINPSNDTPYALSHITFCFDYEVDVSKTANTTFTRTFDWDILKVGAATELLLSLGQTYLLDYQVQVASTAYTDSDWAASGTISIYNPAPVTAHITGVSDQMGSSAVPVDCGVTLPHDLAPYSTLECTYAGTLPDGSALLNEAEVTTTGSVGGGSASADVVFGEPSNLVDECVDVEDDKFGYLGSACVEESTKTFSYQNQIGPFEACGEYTFDNTGRFTTTDTGASESDSWSVSIDVPCLDGCTLTPGYWKTHSERGPAPYDDNWANLSNGADTPFYSSGQSYFDVLWTPPTGNAYYILAHAYIAAQLNALNGANTSAVTSTLAEANTLFETYSPTDLEGLHGKRQPRPAFLEAASILDDYNNGIVGPGHCDE